MVSSLTADKLGNIYLTGRFFGTCYFDTFAIATKLQGSFDLFVAKYSTNGTLVTVISAGATNAITICVGNGIVVDLLGNVHVTGSFAQIAQFDTISISSAGFTDVFVASYNTTCSKCRIGKFSNVSRNHWFYFMQFVPIWNVFYFWQF